MGESAKLSTIVKWDSIECLVNDVVFTEYNLVDYRLAEGGIGLASWGPKIGKSNLVVDKVIVNVTK